MAPNESVPKTEPDSNKVNAISPKWVSEEYFESICSESIKNFSKINKITSEPGSSVGENYASIILRILIECELNDGSTQDFSLMVKASHPKDTQAGQMIGEMQIFDKETEIYNNIIPAFEKLYVEKGKTVEFGPKSYTFSKDPGVETVVLEDLRPKKFKNVNRLEGLDMDHIKSVLKMLAQFHAASAVYYETFGPFNEMFKKGIIDPEKKEITEAMYNLSIPPYKEAVEELIVDGKYYSSKMFTDIKVMMETDFKLFTKIDHDEFNVLNHGDCWANNIMFKHDEKDELEKTLLIDFQMCKWGTPAQDLYYFLFTSAKLDLKLSYFDYFIKYYHEELVSNLKLLDYKKTIPTLTDIHILLFKHQNWATFAITGVMPVVLLDPSENATMDNFLNDSEAGNDFRKKLYTSSRYIKAMNDLLPWLDNRGALIY
ncbi:hypothetical protein ACFFRR_000789 [Megaselia abdita]